MKNLDQLETLKKIRKVPAPPFLLTRIEAKLERQNQDRVPVKWAYALAAGFALLLCFNVLLLSNQTYNNPEASGLEVIIEDMGLSSSNQLYYE